MQNTRWQIINTLKRSGGSTVEGLAKALNLAPMTVRQHLAILERDNYVIYKEVHRSTGRPHHFYTLTPLGDELFPKGYSRLAERMIQEIKELDGEEIGHLGGDEKIELVFKKMAERMAASYTQHIKGENLEERVAEVARILREEEGTLSEWARTDEGYQIEDFNCPYHKVAMEQTHLCTWHLHLLSQMLQAEVIMDLCICEGDGRCRYIIKEAQSPTVVLHRRKNVYH